MKGKLAHAASRSTCGEGRGRNGGVREHVLPHTQLLHQRARHEGYVAGGVDERRHLRPVHLKGKEWTGALIQGRNAYSLRLRTETNHGVFRKVLS